MHGPIHNHLLNGCLDMLNKLGEEVAQKRDEGMPQIG
jgi:mediator of RNA polymerase II transcription subunit 12